MTNIGLLFLDDLRAFGPWISDRGHELLEKSGAENMYAPLTIEPPPGLIVCMRADALFDCWPETPWFRLAKRVALVVETTGVDAEICMWSHDEVQAKREELGNVVHVAHTPEISDSIIQEAAESVATDTEWRTWEQPAIREAAPPGPWLQRELPRWNSTSAPNWEYFIRLVVGGLCLPDGLPVLIDALAGKRIALTSGIADDLAKAPARVGYWRTPAMLPDGRSWLQSDHHSGLGGGGWRLFGARQSERCKGEYGDAIAVEPSGRLAWTGGRSSFRWHVILDEGPVIWTPSNHSWPDGHAKKLYGYEDNEPLWVHLAPDSSMCLSVYEHDVLVAPAPPIRWRQGRSIAIAERTRGGPRALFFVRTDALDGYPADPAAGDEDARDQRAMVCLGSSDDRRYTVGFSKPTWRLINKTAELLGGPTNAWVVYNSCHEPVLAGRGRLLSGWHRWIVFAEDQELIRLDLETEEATRLCAVDQPVDFAIAIPGTPNAILVSIQAETAWYRLV